MTCYRYDKSACVAPWNDKSEHNKDKHIKWKDTENWKTIECCCANAKRRPTEATSWLWLFRTHDNVAERFVCRKRREHVFQWNFHWLRQLSDIESVRQADASCSLGVSLSSPAFLANRIQLARKLFQCKNDNYLRSADNEFSDRSCVV